MLPANLDKVLKPQSSQVTLKNREESEQNLEYVSRKKLEKFKAIYRNSLEKTKSNNVVKSNLQHNDDNISFASIKSTKPRTIIKDSGQPNDKVSNGILKPYQNPFKTSYEEEYIMGKSRKNSLKAKIQEKLQNSNNILQKKLALSTPNNYYNNNFKKNSLPNLSNQSDTQNKTTEKNIKKIANFNTNETPRRDNITPIINDVPKIIDENYGVDNENIEADIQNGPECFVPDLSSISETHLQNILNSDVFQNCGINPITLIDNNPDYFSHLLGKIY